MPKNPEESLLEPGIKGQTWLLPGAGCGFFGIGLLFTIAMPVAIRKQQLKEQKELDEAKIASARQ